jgi:hypothetical protein
VKADPLRSVDELLDVAVECPGLEQLQVEVGRTFEDRVHSGLTGDDGEERHLHAVDEAGGHQRPVQPQAAVRAQRHLGLLLSRATTSTASPRPTVASGQSRGPSSVVDTTVAGRLLIRVTQVPHVGLLGARGQHPGECPIRVRPEDHPLLRAVQGKAVVEQLGSFLAPVAGPVGAGGAVAVEAGKTSKV